MGTISKLPGQSLKNRRMGGGLSLDKDEGESIVPVPEVPSDGVGEKAERMASKSMDNIDPANVSRGGRDDESDDPKDKKKSHQVSVFFSEENFLRLKAYKRKYGASISGAVNAALTQLFDQCGV